MKYLLRFSLSSNLTGITLGEDTVLVHLGPSEVSTLRSHGKTLHAAGIIEPFYRLTSAEYDRMASQPTYCTNLMANAPTRKEVASA